MTNWLAGMETTADRLYSTDLIGKLVFFATRDTNQSISNTTSANIDATNALSWETISLDRLGGWVSGSPTLYTCTYAGWYELSGGIGFNSNATGSRTSGWMVNGSTPAGGHGPRLNANATTTHFQVASSLPVLLAVGDYVRLVPGQSSGAALNTATGGPRPFISIKYVGES
ncbi:hypothetical protein [Streptomyces sp. NPDC057257]|uniref:hypothetical protein n=1 Tax=Streptomyces sp. NPDC057257 TaxID=3346071 RepID=UPI003632FF5B